LRSSEPCFQGFVDEKLLEQELNDRKREQTDFRQVRFESLPRPAPQGADLLKPPPGPEPFGLRIGRTSPVHDFPEGRSRFAGVDLTGENGVPRTITLVPGRDGISSPGDSCTKDLSGHRHLIPIVTFLDSERRPVGPARKGEYGRHDIAVALRFEVPPSARFAIIHTDPTRYAERIKIEGGHRIDLMPVVVPGGVIPIPNPVSGSLNGYATSTGVVGLVWD
jgi:hypothetical protein